jgi:DNA repair protein RadD
VSRTFEPRDYQLAGIDHLRRGISDGHRRLLLVMVMGAGKTVLSLCMMASAVAKGKRSLFLVDRRMLASRPADDARRHGLRVGVIMADHEMDWNAPVQFVSKQTLFERAVRRDRMPLPPADLIFVDEAHRATSEQWRRILELYPNAVVVGLTATPCHGDGSGLGDLYTWLTQPVMPSGLKEKKYIVPASCYAPYIPNLKGVGRGADGDYSKAQLERRLNKANLIGDAVGWWKKLSGDRPTVVFATGVAHSIAVRDEFLNAGIRAAHLDESSGDAEREDAIGDVIAGHTRILTNCDLLTEGVNIPELAVCQLLRPTKRLRRYLQMVGRVLRWCPGKDVATVIDHGGCVLYHGYPDSDFEWTLDPQDCAEKRNEKRMQSGEVPRPVVCQNPECRFQFSGGRKCPLCGQSLTAKQYAKAVGVKQGTLAKVDPSAAATPEESRKQYQGEWRMAINVAVKRRGSCAMAAAIFKGRCKLWPNEADVYPQYPIGERHRPAAEVLAPQLAKKTV